MRYGNSRLILRTGQVSTTAEEACHSSSHSRIHGADTGQGCDRSRLAFPLRTAVRTDAPSGHYRDKSNTFHSGNVPVF